MTAEDLKKSILQQAIQGKLVPQNPDDEPASALLESIRAEKARLVAEGKIKHVKKESVIFRNANGQYIERIGKTEKDITDQIPFEIPDSWEWVRLGTIVQIRGGKRIPAGRKLTTNNTGQIYIRVSDMKDYSIVDTDLHFVPIDIQPLISAYTISKDDIYITVAGTIGRVGLVPNSFDGANLTENADKLTLYIGNKKELVLFLDSPFIQNQIKDLTTQVGQPKLAIQRIYNLLIPLPPLAEQERIVAKIEELMPMVEQHGKAQSRLDELNSSLGDNLRKSVLQYAIQGKLVPQNPDDEPASVLLDRIRAEKARLVAEGKIKRDKKETVVFRNTNGQYIERIGKTEKDITEEIPFEIPDSWEWVRLENITYPVGNKNNQIQSKEILKEGPIPVVSQGQNLIDGYCENIDKRIEDIPLIMFGDHTRNVKYIDFPFVIGADGTKFHKCIIINSRFLFYWMTITADQLRDRGYARHYSLLKQCSIPLPPLAEQERIVAKIEELMTLVEEYGKTQ